ncbi:alpha/beta hydrolase [Rhizobium leguminosarum]|uniref:alpha/beta hydrolase family protein n=1 Tax=Rhizobium leguminosarum TaxID=384 RepID=UPI001C94F3E1|nr:alpha/beta hydrolase [Rhizobium leguminosarum]MBY5775261.1 alpha/beta hydrolase [Rhizobium leguminosarum]
MNAPVRPPRLSSAIIDRVGYFLPRLLFTNARIAPQLHWGDITRALDDFDPALVDPASAAFWDEWRGRFSLLGSNYENLAATSGSPAGRFAGLRSAAAAYHFAEFMYFEDAAIKKSLRQSVRRCFTEAMANSSVSYESRMVKAAGEDIQTFLFFPRDGQQSFACVLLSNGLDSMTEMEILSIGEYLLDRGIAVLLFEGPGQGLDLGVRPLRIEMEAIVADLVRDLQDDRRVDTGRLGFFGVSFGGYFSLRIAQALPGTFRGVVNLSGGPAIAPFTGLPRRLKQDFAFAFASADAQELQSRFDKMQLVGSATVEGQKILSIHGRLDDIFPAAALEAFVSTDSKHHELRLFETEAHVCMNYLHPNLISASDWMLETLGPIRRLSQ